MQTQDFYSHWGIFDGNDLKVLLVDIYQIQLFDAIFTFYHDLCNIEVDVYAQNATFSIGDYLKIDYTN